MSEGNGPEVNENYNKGNGPEFRSRYKKGSGPVVKYRISDSRGPKTIGEVRNGGINTIHEIEEKDGPEIIDYEITEG